MRRARRRLWRASVLRQAALAAIALGVLAATPVARAAGDDHAIYRYERGDRTVFVEGWDAVPVEERARARKVDLSRSRSNPALAADLVERRRPTPRAAAGEPCASAATRPAAPSPTAPRPAAGSTFERAVDRVLRGGPARLVLTLALALLVAVLAAAIVRSVGLATWVRALAAMGPIAVVVALMYLSLGRVEGIRLAGGAAALEAPCSSPATGSPISPAAAEEEATRQHLDSIDHQLDRLEPAGR